MIYQNNTLSRRRGALAIIWLAATLGTKTVFRRISRKEINDVNIQTACHYISEPHEPLTFRNSSTLLVGITRVYNHQCSLHHSHVNVLMLQLKKAIGEVRAKEMNMIDIELPKGGIELFTLEEQTDVILNELPRKILNLEFPPMPIPITRTQLSTPGRLKVPISVPASEITLSPPESFVEEPFEPFAGYPSSELGTPLGGMETPWVSETAPPLMFDLGLEEVPEEAPVREKWVPVKRRKFDVATQFRMSEFEELLASSLSKKLALQAHQQNQKHFQHALQTPYIQDLSSELASMCLVSFPTELPRRDIIEAPRRGEEVRLEATPPPSMMPWSMPESPELPAFPWSPLPATPSLSSVSPSPTLKEYPSPLTPSIESPVFFEEEPSTIILEPPSLPDRESDAFRNYAKSIMQAAGTEELYLNDLIEAAGGKRAAAAQALYHVLVLATRNQAKVAQEMTYGPILLSIYD